MIRVRPAPARAQRAMRTGRGSAMRTVSPRAVVSTSSILIVSPST